MPSLTPAARWAVTRKVHSAGSLLHRFSRGSLSLQTPPPVTVPFASGVTRLLPWLGVPQRSVASYRNLRWLYIIK